MALGKYSRVDGKTSSNYCSTVTVVALVAVCLVGVWMFASLSVVPVQTSNVSTEQENKDNVNEKPLASENKIKDDTRESSSNDNEGNSKQFEDNHDDLPVDATKGDNNANSNQEDKSSNSQGIENTAVQSQEEKKDESSAELEDGSKADTGNAEENKQGEGGETKLGENDSEAGETNESNVNEGDSGNSKSEEVKNGTSEGVEDTGHTNEKVEEKKDGTSEGVEDTGHTNEKVEEEKKDTGEKTDDGQAKGQLSDEALPSIAQSELLNESTTSNGAFTTQAAESKNEKETQKSSEPEKPSGYTWKLCNVTAGPDYIPCLDNLEAVRHLHTTKHYEHRERHCPDDPPTCLVSLPEGYQRSIQWPTSREKIWYHNVPHTQLAQYKGHQNWVKVEGEYLTFPGGGTQFKHGALHYIDFIQQSVPGIAWGKRSRVVLDVGCGVASFGGFLFEREVLTMSLAPKDEHEAQVQFALERGIPAISAVMGTKRLPFPGMVFDVIHCARCRVPWHVEGGKLLLELNRVLRPGGFFVWSATPVYQKLPEDVQIWEEMKTLTKAICWEVVSITKDRINGVGIAVYRKTMTNKCYEQRPVQEPPLCLESDDPSAAWNVPLQACMHKVPVAESERGSQWPEMWPARLLKAPYWLSSSQVGVYGKPEPDDFAADYGHWKRVVSQSYKTGLGIDWSTVRNVMDMRAVYGGFAAALRDMKVWVMNIISIDAPDTLPIIFERGLFGIYHDWCESFSTYPRSYDLLHADHLFSKIKKKCDFSAFVAEVDRILRPEGKIIVRDNAETITEMESIFKSMQWEIKMTYVKDNEGLLYAQKTMWRPQEMETIAYGI